MVPLEAMSCGLPVIISNVGIGSELIKEIPEFVIDGFDYGSVEKYLGSFNKIMNDYASYSKRARDYVITHHSIEKFNKEWRELVENII